MDKISKKAKITGCNYFLYKLGPKRFTERPPNTKIKYYLFDKTQGVFVIVLRRKYHVIEIISCMVILLNFLFFLYYHAPKHIVNISDTIYCNNGIVGLNLLNAPQNEEGIAVRLKLSGKDLIEPIYIAAGSSIGNTYIEDDLKEGSYLCKLEYKIYGKYKAAVEIFDVLLIVR